MKPWWSQLEFGVEQPADCCEKGTQTLYVKTDNGGISFEDTFYVLTTERWAFDSFDELIDQLRKMEQKILAARKNLEKPF